MPRELSESAKANPELMDIEAVQQALGRSRASVYRYANTETHRVNCDYDPRRLNPELRSNTAEPLLFHPNEVARFARDVLRIKPVTIEVKARPIEPTEILQAILQELQAIHQLLRNQSHR